MEPRGVGFETPNQLFLYSRKSEISFLSSGEKFKIVESAFIRCSRSSLLAVIYLKYFDLSWIEIPTGQSISLIGKVPIEILPGKRHIT